MDLLRKADIPFLRPSETVFRISFWGPFITFLLFFSGLLVGVGLFIYCYQSDIIWGMFLSGLYLLLMWFLSHILLRALLATFSTSNWLARIGPNGLLLKYRSYLHDDYPSEDPIALRLSWSELTAARLEKEIHTTLDVAEKQQHTRWFLILKLDSRFLDPTRIKAALDFENQRKPDYYKIAELQHKLFEARKAKADPAVIDELKQVIALEKKKYPGKTNKSQFRDRPVVFVKPDSLKMEWTHLKPGKKKLRQLLAQHTRVTEDLLASYDVEAPMTETEFQSHLETLLGRDDTLEAVKLVKIQKNLSTTEAKAFVEHRRGKT